MLLMNDERRYGAVAKSLHWIAAALFVALFMLGWTMTELPLGAEKFERYNLHKSVGVTVLLLMACAFFGRPSHHLNRSPTTCPYRCAAWQS